MSEENIERLRVVYDEWGRGNWQPRFDFYAPDMEWGWSDEFPGLAAGGRENENPWEKWRCEAEEFVAAGDFVVALTRYTGRGKGSKVDVNSLGAHVWRFRDGQAVRLEVFSSRERALAAAGLSASAQG
jgi:ketosteroid isomerase-like protein